MGKLAIGVGLMYVPPSPHYFAAAAWKRMQSRYGHDAFIRLIAWSFVAWAWRRLCDDTPGWHEHLIDSPCFVSQSEGLLVADVLSLGMTPSESKTESAHSARECRSSPPQQTRRSSPRP